MGASKYNNNKHSTKTYIWEIIQNWGCMSDNLCWVHQRQHTQNGPVAAWCSDSGSIPVMSYQCILLWISCFHWCFHRDSEWTNKNMRECSYVKGKIHSRNSLVYRMRMMAICIKLKSGTQKKPSALLSTPTSYSSVLRISWDYQCILEHVKTQDRWEI